VQLIGYEASRVVQLTNVGRLAGGVVVAELAQQVVQKFSFLKFPTLDDLLKEGQTFGLGKFQGVQITELKVYSDGVIVSGGCNTNILDAFLQELFAFIKADFGLDEIRVQEPEKHFESSIMVRAERDLVPILSPPKRVTSLIEQTISGVVGREYEPTTVYFETDSDPLKLKMRRRPNRFTLERKIGLPFSTNAFYSQAPLKSDDHFALLEALEGLAD
jgi:hypothetical protein